MFPGRQQIGIWDILGAQSGSTFCGSARGQPSTLSLLPYPPESSSPLHALENSGGKNFRAVTDVRGISISTNGIVSLIHCSYWGSSDFASMEDQPDSLELHRRRLGVPHLPPPPGDEDLPPPEDEDPRPPEDEDVEMLSDDKVFQALNEDLNAM